MNIINIETERINCQKKLDSERQSFERNKLGQFATPADLAEDILKYAGLFFDEDKKVRFLDPAIGTGSFFSALLKVFNISRIESAVGYEIDSEYADVCNKLWKNTLLKVHIADYTTSIKPDSEKEFANLIICNPPYVRHHHISRESKLRLMKLVHQVTGLKISGLSGLYCYFLLLSHAKLETDGYACWLVPSEFMDVKYGDTLKEYLLNKVTLIQIHRFNPLDLQFKDALVSSAIVCFKKTPPSKNNLIKFSYGGALNNPLIHKDIPLEELHASEKWTQYPIRFKEIHNTKKSILSDWFTIKRGIATGANKFFIINYDDAKKIGVPNNFMQPILPSSRYLSDEIEIDAEGNPKISKKLFLLNIDYPEERIKSEFPKLWNYLQKGIEEGISEGYLCSNRKPWYKQEKRSAAPILCTYMGRKDNDKKPFRFILNHSNAIATNVYLLMYPNPQLQVLIDKNPSLLRKIWEKLSDLPKNVLINEGRIYGGGLHKIEPNELSKVSADWINDLLEIEMVSKTQNTSLDCIKNGNVASMIPHV